jgi:hypothetical protein
MTANELVDLDVDGWTELQPGTAYEAMGTENDHCQEAALILQAEGGSICRSL